MDTVCQAKSDTALLKFDIAITGGGMVGLTLAAALAKNANLSILILESNAESAAFNPAVYHHRVSALALSSVRIFQSLQVWQAMRHARVSPFTSIQVWDANNPSPLQFQCNDIAEPVLGYIVENNVMQQALREKVKSLPNVCLVSPVKLTGFTETDDSVVLTTEDARRYAVRVAIATDGANSWLREQAGIRVQAGYYDQEAVVTTVLTECPHEKSARQVFLPTGPLAFLPLQEANTTSIVWSLPREEAQQKLALTDEDFKSALQQAFASRLGKIISVEKRFTFPLKKQQAEHYVRSRVVLAGDAAHVMHPLAGQGVNIGLLDAASLAEVILDAIQAKRDFSEISCLRRYERWRRADNLALLAGVDAIKHLFASDNVAVQTARTLGFAMASRVSMLKNIFTRHAVGCREGLPRLANIQIE